jgi:hypothetical protein
VQSCEIDFTAERREIKKIKMEDLPQKITLTLQVLLTGGTFIVSVDSDITVDFLKKIVSKKLKISKERICLMNSER